MSTSAIIGSVCLGRRHTDDVRSSERIASGSISTKHSAIFKMISGSSIRSKPPECSLVQAMDDILSDFELAMDGKQVGRPSNDCEFSNLNTKVVRRTEAYWYGVRNKCGGCVAKEYKSDGWWKEGETWTARNGIFHIGMLLPSRYLLFDCDTPLGVVNGEATRRMMPIKVFGIMSPRFRKMQARLPDCQKPHANHRVEHDWVKVKGQWNKRMGLKR